MITAWILYAIVVGALLGLAAWATEKLLRTHSLPSRWVWACAVLLSVSLPLGHWVWVSQPIPIREISPVAVESPTRASGTPATESALPVEAITVTVPRESILRSLDGPVMVFWGLSSGLLLAFFLLLFVRTEILRRRWDRGKAGGHSVLISDEWGPAVVGLLKPQVVLPRWCRRLDEKAMELILDHELEHVRAGDLKLMATTGIIPLLFPWHLPIWWQMVRLRTAIEGDCDLRVLGRNPGSMRDYLELLIDVGERSSGRRPLAVMLSEPYETLKRRIKIMTVPFPKKPRIRGGLLAGGGAALIALAGWAPAPMDAEPEPSESMAIQEPAGGSRSAGEQETPPTFTPYTVRPAIKNLDVVMATLEGAYPPLMKDASIGGTVNVWFFLEETGQALRTLVNESSGHQALDEAALTIANVIQFSPALNRDQKKPVWVSIPIEFTMDEAADEGGAEAGRALQIQREWPDVPEVEPGVPQETGDVAGTTMDAQTGQPVAFTQVFLPGTGLGTLSNREGRFLIENVPTGERLVVAEMVGYDLPGQTVTVSVDKQVEVEFGLRATAIAFHKLVVKGSGGH